jgi:hypothetical protein
MGIFRDISLSYDGQEYIITPSNRLLRMIEGKGRQEVPSFNLVLVLYHMQTGAGSLPDMAFILAEFLRSAGAKITEDQALAHISTMSAVDLQALKDRLCECVMPEVKEKKEPAQSEAA